MADDKKTLYYLDDLSGYKVDSDYSDVTGWEVIDANHKTIGKVDRLLVNKKTERVVYLDVEVDKSLLEYGADPYEKPASEGVHQFLNKDGENHLIIPIGLVHIDEDNKKVISDRVDSSTFSKTKRYRKGEDFDFDYEKNVVRGYNEEDTDWDDNLSDDTFYDRPEFDDRRYKRPDGPLGH
jgi:sporulation protein YlmC with PRC-barrel domain